MGTPLGEDVQPSCMCSGRWPCAAERLNFQNELDFREFAELLFLKVIKSRIKKKCLHYLSEQFSCCASDPMNRPFVNSCLYIPIHLHVLVFGPPRAAETLQHVSVLCSDCCNPPVRSYSTEAGTVVIT